MKIEVGQFYTQKSMINKQTFIVQIVEIKNDEVYIRFSDTSIGCRSIADIKKYWKFCKKRNTPLYKALNG